MHLDPNHNYTNSALRIGDADPYPQRLGRRVHRHRRLQHSVNDEYKHVILKVHPHALTAYAGQMFHLLCPSPDGAEVWMRRPMSVYRVDKANGQVEFLYKVEGRGTRGMAMLEPGDDFNIAGPLGHGFRLEPSWRNIVVLGRGVGLATLAPLSQLAAENKVGVTAILSARNPGVVMSRELFEGLGAKTITVLDSDGSSAVDNVETILEGLIAENKADAFFTCGSNRLLKLMQRLGKKHDIPGQVGDGADHGLRLRRLLRLHAHLRGRRRARATPRLPRRPGVQHAGGGGMVDLSVKIGAITLQNPVQPASGAFSWEYNDVIDLNRLGALVAKTICREPRLGNPTPRMAETEAGIIQSIGLPGKGHRLFHRAHRPRIRQVQAAAGGQRLVGKHRGFRGARRGAERAGRRRDRGQYLLPDAQLQAAATSRCTRTYTRDCITAMRAKTKKPLWVKLSPNAGDIVSIARAAEDAGADALVIANTFLSLKIRTDNFRPALGNKFGGLVSPALKPIVLRMVYQVAKQVKIPIIGIGGVTKAEDVVEYMLAGASAVGIGYAGFRNPTALITIIDDLEAWCDERGIKKVTELIGAVRDQDMETDTLAAASVGV